MSEPLPPPASVKSPPPVRHYSRIPALLLVCLTQAVGIVAALLAAAWAFGALWFDAPFLGGNGSVPNTVLAWGWVILLLGVFIRVRPWRWAWGAALLLWLAVLLPWLSLKPTNDRDWPPEVARTGYATVKGDLVTLHNVRNFDYSKDGPPIERWETRTVNLMNLRGIDLFMTYWGSPWIAHSILSFDFGPEGHLAFSIETRPERGEPYSAIGGLYRQFELTYIAADERDVIRVRSNYRKDEEVYLYHLNATPEGARARFLEYVTQMDELHTTPRFYNAVTANCTTSIRSQAPAGMRVPLNWRILLNGKLDEWLYNIGGIDSGGLPFAELKKRALINPKAQAADQDPDFSRRIREGIPGFH